MKGYHFKRLLALVMAFSMILGLGMPNVSATTVSDTETGTLTYEKLDPSEISVQTVNTTGQVQENDSEFSYEDSDEVRVMIVLDKEPAISLVEDEDEEIAENAEIQEYREELKKAQQKMAKKISKEVLGGKKLSVEWNLTLVTNAISATVKYGQMAAIAELDGVKSVYMEQKHMPMSVADTNNIVAQEMTGASTIKEEVGYTGAGTRVSIIDTGTDTDHQSFSAAAYEYSLKKLAEKAEKVGVSYEEYIASLNLLTKEKLAEILENNELNCETRYEGLTVDDLYLDSKNPFAFNYVDNNLDVTHDNDDQGSHGSHVAGITTANTYIDESVNTYDYNCDGSFTQADVQTLLEHAIKGTEIVNEKTTDMNSDGAVTAFDAHLLLKTLESYVANGANYVSAAEAVGVTGVAPDAQLLTMKVFGTNGGAFTSDYMAATEDAMVLGCDVANLSLGTGYPGFTIPHEEDAATGDYINGVLQEITTKGMVMSVAAGNAGNWADEDNAFQMMYTDEAGTSTHGEPATFYNSLAVASVDDVGRVSVYQNIFHNGKEGDARKEASIVVEEVSDGMAEEWATLDPDGEGTEYEVAFVGNPQNLFNGRTQYDTAIYGGSAEDFEGKDYTGKIVLVARGNGVLFSDKHMNSALAGAAAVLIYNNVSGSLGISIEGSTATVPCAGITLDQAKEIAAVCSYSYVDGYTGKLQVKTGLQVDHGKDVKYPTMSDFSSWGTTGAINIKPEITAPGGGIYSVNGVLPETNGYEHMSGTSMATPHISGLVALAAQYIREENVLEAAKEASGISTLTQRNLIQSLLMSTAEPLIEECTVTEEEIGVEYSVRNQGSGLGNIKNVVNAESFILMEDLMDGKVKAELGDGTAARTFTFSINNITDKALTYDLRASILTTGTTTGTDEDGNTYTLSTDWMQNLAAKVTYTGEAVEGSKVTVAAKGNTEVTVTIEVIEEAVTKMTEEGYTNGFYLEGFVYITPETTEEGVIGVEHSIPLLGWYGNWTDPSMFDSGSYIENIYGNAQRPSHIADPIKNVFTWCPKGDNTGYYYTGNIYGAYNPETGQLIGDQRYIEERNAITTIDSNWSFYAVFPTVIRGVGDFMIQVVDAETKEVYYEDDYETFDDVMIPSFYYDAYQQWYDVTYEYGVGVEWDFTDKEGKPLEEGTNIEVRLVCAPEYYMTGQKDENGKDIVRWEDLGKGASLSYKFTVDNTAPDLAYETAVTPEDGTAPAGGLTLENGELKFTVQDNNYVAAVILMNGSATEIAEYYYPDMGTKGEIATGSFDIINYRVKYGNKATIAICDYAGNETYYAVNLNGEGIKYGEFVGFQYDAMYGINQWVSFSEGVNETETKICIGNREIVAAEYVDGFVFAQTASGELYGFPYADMLADSVDFEDSFIARLETVYQDFAYNYADGTLYALSVNEYEGVPASVISPIYFEPDQYSGSYEGYGVVDKEGLAGLTLACDDNGNFYVLGTTKDEETGKDTTAHLWKSTLEEGDWGPSYGALELVGDTGYEMDFLQSMTWDHNNESLYWARFYPKGLFSLATELMKVDPYTGTCTKVGTLSGETAGLFAPLNSRAAAKAEHQNVPAFDTEKVGKPVLASKNLALNVGATQKLDCSFDPWYTSKKAVTWTSSDENVATVDERGVVTAKATGSCTITVTAVEDPSLTATCTVSVSSLSLKINGITSVSEGGIGSFKSVNLYEYTMKDGVAEMTIGNPISDPEGIAFGLSIASSVEAKGSLWVCEWANTGMIYELSKAGEVKKVIEPIDGDMMFGLAYSEATENFTGIMNYYLYVDQPLTDEAKQEQLDSFVEGVGFTWHKFDMSEYLNATVGNLQTNEDGKTKIVFTGITSIDNKDKTPVQDNYKDFTGGWASDNGVSYTPDTTWVLMDNVGRLWYIDETTGLKKESDEWATFYMDEAGTAMIDSSRNGVFAQGYDTDEDGEDDTYSVFVIRELKETAMYDMFLNETMPAITYSFSDIHYVEDEKTGTPMFFISMYDYFNEGTTNQLYLYIPGEEGKPDYGIEGTPDILYSLGDTGFGNMLSTIHSAEVTGGLELGGSENGDTEAGEGEGTESLTGIATIYKGRYME